MVGRGLLRSPSSPQLVEIILDPCYYASQLHTRKDIVSAAFNFLLGNDKRGSCLGKIKEKDSSLHATLPLTVDFVFIRSQVLHVLCTYVSVYYLSACV